MTEDYTPKLPRKKKTYRVDMTDKELAAEVDKLANSARDKTLKQPTDPDSYLKLLKEIEQHTKSCGDAAANTDESRRPFSRLIVLDQSLSLTHRLAQMDQLANIIYGHPELRAALKKLDRPNGLYVAVHATADHREDRAYYVSGSDPGLSIEVIRLALLVEHEAYCRTEISLGRPPFMDLKIIDAVKEHLRNDESPNAYTRRRLYIL